MNLPSFIRNSSVYACAGKWYRRFFKTARSYAYKSVDYKKYAALYENEVEKIIESAKRYQRQLSEMDYCRNTKEPLKNYEAQITLLDRLGPILIKEVDGKKIFYRGIVPEKTDDFMELYKSGALQALADAGRVVAIKLTDYYTEDYPLVIEMETLIAVPASYWSFGMIRESAINVLVVNSVLEYFGFQLLDGHAANSAFKGTLPVFFDVGSLCNRKNKRASFVNEFIARYLNTLLMLSAPESYFSRFYINSNCKISPPVIHINDSIEMDAIKKRFFRYHARHSSQVYNALLYKLFIRKEIKPEYIKTLFAHTPKKTSMWGEYQKSAFAQKEPDKRRQRIIDLAAEYSPDAASCLDIAGNQGYVAHLLSNTKRYDSVISIDYDENAIEAGREYLRESPVHLYLVNPFVPMGSYESIASLIRADIVLALALTHHLLLTQNYNIDAVLQVIALYSKKYVYIEFCPLGMYDGGDVLPERPNWYTDDWFATHFAKHFNLLHREVVGAVSIPGTGGGGGAENSNTACFISV